MHNRRQPEAIVLPVHFEDRSGPEFERAPGRRYGPRCTWCAR